MGVKQKTKSLRSRASDFSDTFYQLKVLRGEEKTTKSFKPFARSISENGYSEIKPGAIQTLQINIGKLCNQTCAHCHVDAGPDRKDEQMSREHLEICLEILINHKIPTVDITGGAPEMNEHFRWFVESCSEAGVQVIDRCNLTIIRANPKYYDLPEFFAKHKVQVVSSLPSFSQRRTDSQRGDGVFEDSIEALKMLNAVGYGMPDTDLELHLVYNPSGAYLPDSQETLEREFKRQLDRKFGIQFNNLFAITNLPIARFLEYLVETENYEDYMQALIEAYNPATIDGLMCRSTISVSWDGYLYDCDFNQMLEMPVRSESQHISNFDAQVLSQRTVAIDQHCYGCTAGAGSSCGGEIG